MYVCLRVRSAPIVTSSELTTAQGCPLLDNGVYYNIVLELEESIEVIKRKNRVITC